jgi:hypothetical protein
MSFKGQLTDRYWLTDRQHNVIAPILIAPILSVKATALQASIVFALLDQLLTMERFVGQSGSTQPLEVL